MRQQTRLLKATARPTEGHEVALPTSSGHQRNSYFHSVKGKDFKSSVIMEWFSPYLWVTKRLLGGDAHKLSCFFSNGVLNFVSVYSAACYCREWSCTRNTLSSWLNLDETVIIILPYSIRANSSMARLGLLSVHSPTVRGHVARQLCSVKCIVLFSIQHSVSGSFNPKNYRQRTGPWTHQD